MILSEGTEVIYKDNHGTIDFVCDSYVVLQIKSDEKINSPRSVIYKKFLDEIQILND